MPALFKECRHNFYIEPLYPTNNIQRKKSSICSTFFVVVPRGFEPRQTEPKPVVLPLHHRTILMCFLLKSCAKVRHFIGKCKFLATLLYKKHQKQFTAAIILPTSLSVSNGCNGRLNSSAESFSATGNNRLFHPE